jgi:hypothetical protein
MGLNLLRPMIVILARGGKKTGEENGIGRKGEEDGRKR